MLTVQIICVGKLKEGYLQQASAEYQKRLGHFAGCRLWNCRNINCRRILLPRRFKRASNRKASRFSTQCRNRRPFKFRFVLRGKNARRKQLAQLLSQAALEGNSTVNFIIGGSYGLSDA